MLVNQNYFVAVIADSVAIRCICRSFNLDQGPSRRGGGIHTSGTRATTGTACRGSAAWHTERLDPREDKSTNVHDCSYHQERHDHCLPVKFHCAHGRPQTWPELSP